MMKHAHVVTVIGMMALIGCGGGDSGGADARVIIFTDAGGGDGGLPQACNPVSQTGCQPGEKCANNIIQDEPRLALTECVPDGTVGNGGGEMCTIPETGHDDCVAGLGCRNGTCREICTQAPNSCDDGYCVLISKMFDDLDGVGLCADKCHPVQQDCPVENEACYLNATLGQSACSRVPEETEGILQGQPCYGPEPGSCYLNGCPAGYGAILNDTTGDGSLCAAYCSPVTSHSGDFSMVGGAAPYDCLTLTGIPGLECRFINSFYNNTGMVPDSVGMCVPPAEWDSCQNHTLGAQTQEDFVPGCEPLGVPDPAAASRIPEGVKLPKFQGDIRALLGR